MQAPSNNVSRSGMFRETQETPMQNEGVNFRKMVDEAASKLRVDVSINDDEEITARVSHTMLRGERLGEWFARVGLGKSQILLMSKGEIREFVALTANNEIPAPPVPHFVEDKTPVEPKFRFIMTD